MKLTLWQDFLAIWKGYLAICPILLCYDQSEYVDDSGEEGFCIFLISQDRLEAADHDSDALRNRSWLSSLAPVTT